MPTSQRLLNLSLLLLLLLWLAMVPAVGLVTLGAMFAASDLADHTDAWDGFGVIAGSVVAVAGLIALAVSALRARAVSRGRRRLRETGDPDPLLRAAFATACVHGVLTLCVCVAAARFGAAGAVPWLAAGGALLVIAAALTATVARGSTAANQPISS